MYHSSSGTTRFKLNWFFYTLLLAIMNKTRNIGHHGTWPARNAVTNRFFPSSSLVNWHFYDIFNRFGNIADFPCRQNGDFGRRLVTSYINMTSSSIERTRFAVGGPCTLLAFFELGHLKTGKGNERFGLFVVTWHRKPRQIIFSYGVCKKKLSTVTYDVTLTMFELTCGRADCEAILWSSQNVPKIWGSRVFVRLALRPRKRTSLHRTAS